VYRIKLRKLCNTQTIQAFKVLYSLNILILKLDAQLSFVVPNTAPQVVSIQYLLLASLYKQPGYWARQETYQRCIWYVYIIKCWAIVWVIGAIANYRREYVIGI